MIRPYREEDFELVTKFWFEAMDVAMPGLEQRMGHTLDGARQYFRDVVSKENQLWVYELDGVPVGYLALRDEFVDRLYVDPAFHRRDIGRALFDHAKLLSPQHLWLYTHAANKVARAFYEKNGCIAEKYGVSPARNPSRMWSITGAPTFERSEVSTYNSGMRPTYLEVNLSQLKTNLDGIRAQVAPAKVLVVLKANAYGHGVDGVAPFIAPFADYIGVALVEEGIHLRKLGIRTPILVMGGTLPDQLPYFFEHDLTLAASSPDLLASAQLAALSVGKRLTVHLKIDTGMERTGVHEYEAGSFIEKSLSCSQLEIQGIFTHFANSEIVESAGKLMNSTMVTASLQLERFEEVLSIYEKLGEPQPHLRHMANSAATLLRPESYFDMVRPGILFYGVYPARDIERTIDVQPALTWKSRVVHSKITQPGRGVSYGSLWQAENSARIVTIPCGYADGYFRRMTNQARVLINGKKYPQVGRICMDQFMVNAGEDVIKTGDEVILLGGEISPEDLADWTGTNEYEVMTNISARVPRVYVTD